MSKFLLIANPISGGKNKQNIVKKVGTILQQYNNTVVVKYTEYQGHASILAKESNCDVVVAIGGDGTVSEVAQGLIGSNKIMGIIPCGSGDGLALHLGISRNIALAAKNLIFGKPRQIDYGLVNNQVFFCTTGVGFDAEVAMLFAGSKTRGLWTYIKIAFKAWKNFKPSHYTLNIDGQQTTTTASIITVGNCNQWGNYAKITPIASVCDGILDVCIVKPFKLIELPYLAYILLTGKANKCKKVMYYKGKNVDITLTSSMPAHFDGDPIILPKHIHISVVPKGVTVIVPYKKTI